MEPKQRFTGDDGGRISICCVLLRILDDDGHTLVVEGGCLEFNFNI